MKATQYICGHVIQVTCSPHDHSRWPTSKFLFPTSNWICVL